MIAAEVAEATGGRILLVDDDTQLVRGLRFALEKQGHIVRAIHRGAGALEVALHFKPQLVVLDVMMPGVDGWEVLRLLRSNPVTEKVPVIMLTAKDSEAAKVEGFSLGADDYVTKPFSLQEFRCRVTALMKRAKHVDELASEGGTIPVVVCGSGHDFVNMRDIYFIEGIRNYTYVHARDNRFLSRLTLHAADEKCASDEFMRVHRSFIVNLSHVRGCYWASKSSYRLRLNDGAQTEIPVSRSLVGEVKERLGLKS